MAKNLYAIVSEQFPQFVSAQYPAFVEFVKTYYKWLEDNYPTNYGELIDIDQTSQYFVTFFKNALDVDGILSGTFDNRYLKYIKQIYGVKGSQQALARILQIVYRAEVVVDYPGEYVLRASDGRWEQLSFITCQPIHGTLDLNVHSCYINNIHVFVDSIVSHGGDFRIYFNKRTDLDLSIGDYVKTDDFVGSIVKSPSSLKVTSGGRNWQLGQVFIIPGTTNSIGKITKVNNLGTVEKAIVYEFGYGHTENQIIEVFPNTINDLADKLVLQYQFDVVSTQEGHWKDDKGKISNNVIRLQDNFYYQQFSYVVDSNVNSSLYVDLAKSLNPAGLQMFNNSNLQSTFSYDILAKSSIPYNLISVADLVRINSSVNKTILKTPNEIVPVSDSILVQYLRTYHPITDTVQFGQQPDIIEYVDGHYSLNDDYFAQDYNRDIKYKFTILTR